MFILTVVLCIEVIFNGGARLVRIKHVFHFNSVHLRGFTVYITIENISSNISAFLPLSSPIHRNDGEGIHMTRVEVVRSEFVVGVSDTINQIGFVSGVSVY